MALMLSGDWPFSAHDTRNFIDSSRRNPKASWRRSESATHGEIVVRSFPVSVSALLSFVTIRR
ncbi:hypothetical protein AU894_28470 [Salmonella enterica subsp. enterica]|uniref:Uncharacterized protein n=1 Tax=Salmonella enterica subsp. enterica serovar Java TaxID=224729 RepID=A0A3Y9C7W2_SALEB|nr:hypothetical protein [Salmonella enterica subsp. enterica serovar Java]